MGRTTHPLAAVLTCAALALGAACGDGDGRSADGRVRVAAGFSRLGELATTVGGDRVRVDDLTPSGAEPHDVELGSDDLDRLEDADLVLYLGGGFQPGLAKAADRADRAVDLLAEDERDDPHIWLDPVRWAEAANAVGDALAEADPPGAAAYRERATAFRAELEALHADMETGLATCQRRMMVTAHAAFGRMAARYRLEQEPITGISPEAEPDPKRLASLADLVKEQGVTHVFTEELVSPRVARALAREAGVQVAVLDPLEGRVDGGYVAGMRRNLDTLRSVLGCT